MFKVVVNTSLSPCAHGSSPPLIGSPSPSCAPTPSQSPGPSRPPVTSCSLRRSPKFSKAQHNRVTSANLDGGIIVPITEQSHSFASKDNVLPQQ